jgi:hypothetical protein
MSEERKCVQLILENGIIENGNFVLHHNENVFRLSLEFSNLVIAKTGHSVFHLLQEIRKELEPKRILINCYGASKNVRPSGMSISMSGGIRAYKLLLGVKPKLPEDLVDVFETGPDVQLVTVAEQDAFFDEWLASVGIDKTKKVIPLSVKIDRWSKWVLLGVLILVLIYFCFFVVK